MAHTEGPWQVLPDLSRDQGYGIVGANMTVVAGRIQNKDDARAIGALLDLLEACEFGGPSRDGPELLDTAADSIDAMTSQMPTSYRAFAQYLADLLREKAELERAAIAKALENQRV